MKRDDKLLEQGAYFLYSCFPYICQIGLKGTGSWKASDIKFLYAKLHKEETREGWLTSPALKALFVNLLIGGVK